MYSRGENMKNEILKNSIKLNIMVSKINYTLMKKSKGAGFFEYALLALVAVALMALVYALFADRINDLFKDSVNPDIQEVTPNR
jgi:Flp pilus assembly pilin Flp